MSTHKEYALIAILATIAVIGVVPAFAYCPPICAPKADYYYQIVGTGGINTTATQPIRQPLEQIVPLVVSTDKTMYDHASTVTITGHVNNPYPGMDVGLKIISPSGNVVSAAQLTVDSNGSFGTTISTASPLMIEDGEYTVYVQLGDEQARNNAVLFQILTPPKVPEFGPIAALVLAIAIISIIAVSAKTGLRFMPKY